VLDGNDLSDRGTEVVVMATAPCHLYQLHLNNNDIGDVGASAFLERRFLKLAELSLSGNSGISTRMAMSLKKKLGTKSPPCYLLGF
jgi:Leucine Rich repeat